MDRKTVFTMKEYLSDVNDGVFERFSKVYADYQKKKTKINNTIAGILGFGFASFLISLDIASIRTYTFDGKVGSMLLGLSVLVISFVVKDQFYKVETREMNQHLDKVFSVVEESRTLKGMLEIAKDLDIVKVNQLCRLLNDLQQRNLEVILSNVPLYVAYDIDHYYFDNVILRDRDTNDMFTYSRNSYTAELFDYQFYTWNDNKQLVKAKAAYSLQSGIDIVA